MSGDILDGGFVTGIESIEARVLLNTLQCTRQFHTIKNYLAQNVNSEKVGKPWYKRSEYIDYALKAANVVKYGSMAYETGGADQSYKLSGT